MLDIDFIREHTDAVRDAVAHKRMSVDIDELLALDTKRRALQTELEQWNKKRNENAASMKSADAAARADRVSEGKEIKQQIARLQSAVDEVEKDFRQRMLLVPNVYSADTPIGPDENTNKEVRTWGRVPEFSFEIKSHEELGRMHDLMDTERGVKVAGFRGYYLKNEGAMLQWALMSYCMDAMRAKGFTVMIPPTLVREMALIGSGHFPALREESYPVEDEKFLAGTSEPALLAYRAEEILQTQELPLKYCAVSPCYRREVGSYGKDTKGLYRVHEFWKVEQIVIAEADLAVSIPLFEELLANAEEILQSLKLPYRVLQICTGDMGAGKYKMYDIETWMPSRRAWGETHSCSHLTDWQARRLSIRYKNKEGRMVHPHAMNNTVIASPRILIAILENYQQADGTITVPDVLRPYLGGKERIG